MVQYYASVRCKFQFQVTQIDSVVVAEFFWLIAVNSFNSFGEPSDNSMLSIVVKKTLPIAHICPSNTKLQYLIA